MRKHVWAVSSFARARVTFPETGHLFAEVGADFFVKMMEFLV